MSEVRITRRVKSRLASLALGHGGIMAHEAVTRADKAIDAKSEALLAAIDAILVELEARFGAGSADGAVGDCEGLYGLASGIIDVANCLRGSLIDKAAYALCNLADLSAELNVWDRQAVEVHIMVLRLLRNGGDAMSEARRERVVEGLHKVTAKRIGKIEGETAEPAR